MKIDITKYDLQDLYDKLNKQLFDYKLPKCKLLISTSKAYTARFSAKYWKNNNFLYPSNKFTTDEIIQFSKLAVYTEEKTNKYHGSRNDTLLCKCFHNSNRRTRT